MHHRCTYFECSLDRQGSECLVVWYYTQAATNFESQNHTYKMILLHTAKAAKQHSKMTGSSDALAHALWLIS